MGLLLKTRCHLSPSFHKSTTVSLQLHLKQDVHYDLAKAGLLLSFQFSTLVLRPYTNNQFLNNENITKDTNMNFSHISPWKIQTTWKTWALHSQSKQMPLVAKREWQVAQKPVRGHWRNLSIGQGTSRLWASLSPYVQCKCCQRGPLYTTNSWQSTFLQKPFVQRALLNNAHKRSKLSTSLGKFSIS